MARRYQGIGTLRSWTVQSVSVILIKAQLRWEGHDIRTDDHRMLRQLLNGELEASKRKQGCPCKQYKDTVKGNLQWCSIEPKELEAAASDRSHWRSLTHTASTVKDSWLPMNIATEHLLTSKQESSSAPPVPDSALPDWVCRAT